MDKKKNFAHEALIILAVIALLTFICRLWAILLLVIIGIIIAVVRMAFISVKEPEVIEPRNTPNKQVIPTEADVKKLAHYVILRRVNEFIAKDFPDARWIWEASNAKELIEKGGEVYIWLNRAGGYKRAKVIIANLQVLRVEYQTNHLDEPSETGSDNGKDESLPKAEEMAENYELIAFEWVEAHIMELNQRCNDAIGSRMSEILISADELPVRESWEDICCELTRADISDVKCIPEGIKINLCS